MVGAFALLRELRQAILAQTPAKLNETYVFALKARRCTVVDGKKIEEIAKQINDAIPAGVKEMAGNVESRVKQVLQQQLAKLDLVTHEEMDVQQQMLLRLRQRVEQLEQALAAREAAAKPVAETTDKSATDN